MSTRYRVIRTCGGRISFLVEKNSLVVLLILATAAIMFFILGLGLGGVWIPPERVVQALWGEGTAQELLIVNSFRLPRIITGFLVGAALAISGVMLQAIVRNPLASPEAAGMVGGASVAAVGFLTFTPGVSIHWLPLPAFAGALLATLFVYLLAWKRGVSPMILILIGIGISMAARGLTMIFIAMGDIYSASQAVIWLTGSLYGSSWQTVWILFPWLAVFLPLTFYWSRDLNVLQLGESVGAAVGCPVQRKIILLVITSAALSGSAVAFAGAIGFVGLIAPHMTRMLVGPSHERLIPAAAISGGVLVMSADLLARTGIPPYDLPAGLFTAAVGAPFFLYLLHRNYGRRIHRGGI